MALFRRSKGASSRPTHVDPRVHLPAQHAPQQSRDKLDEPDVAAALGMDPSADPRFLLSLLNSNGVCFTIRDRKDPATLLAVLGPRFKSILRPASAFHYEFGPADQRCVVQVLDLGDESLVAAVCTGQNASTQSTSWLLENVHGPIGAAAKAIGSRYGMVAWGHFDKEDADLPDRIPGAKVVPIASL
jgi:hypothetical protein